MIEQKQGFLFHFIHDTGNGTQIQATFGLPVGSKKKDIDEAFDGLAGALKRRDALVRLDTIEAQYLQQKMLVAGTQKAVDRLHDAPQLNGKRRTVEEAQYHQSLTQLEAETAKLELYKKSLEHTAKEAEVEIPECIRQAS